MALSTANVSAMFKEIYSDNIENLIPEAAKLIKLIPFASREKQLGSKYHQPLIVQNENGVTYSAADQGAYSLEAAVSMQMADAQVSSSQMTLRSSVAHDVLARSQNSKGAFIKGTELLVDSMLESITKRLEISMLHGGSGIGVKASSANINSTSTTVTISSASFAPGIYSGAEGSKIQFYLVSSGALVSSGTDAVFNIDAVDIDAKTIKVSGSATGITALDASASSDIFFKGSNGAEMAGLKKIITNTGTLFNVSAATYNLWKGNTYDCSGGALTLAKIQAAVSKAVARGLNEKVTLFVNPKGWGNLCDSLNSLRQFDSSYSPAKGENGVESLVFHSQNGLIEVVSHNLVKEGEAFIVPLKRVKRLGSTEITFSNPMGNGDIFLTLPDSNGFELRVYSDQCIFVEAPARCVYLSNIVNA
jgi:hypothetical protein